MGNAPTYEEEQAKLKAEFDGKQIHIDAPKEAEVKPEVYKDVEPMLFRGFLTISADIRGVPFVFKSLNHHEFEMIRFMGDFRDKGLTDGFWDIFLAYGVFMVGGVNVLPTRDQYIPTISETFKALPGPAKNKIVRYLSELNRRASNAVTLVEAYATENYSRYYWAQFKGMDPTSTSVSGIDGTSKLGMNWAQQVWRALNYFEDRNEEHEREWENAKFVGSCMAGKGISKVYNQDTDRRTKAKEERLARKDKVLRQVLLGERPDEAQKQFPGAIVTVAKTVEDLASQLERDLRGEKDWHDQVVEAQENRAREGIQARQQQLETLAKEYEAQYGTAAVTGGVDMTGLSAAEVQQRVVRQRQLQNQALARRVSDPRVAQELLDKWGAKESSDIMPIEAVPASIRKPGTPFKR